MFTDKNDIDALAEAIDLRLCVNDSFDIIRRELSLPPHRAFFYYIDGLVKSAELQKMLTFLLGLDDFGDGVDGAAERFTALHLPDVEVDITDSEEDVIRGILSGCCVMISSGFAGRALVIDLRSYPARETQDCENDRVMRGARDGFVETLIFNTALIRRRIRDPQLRMKYFTVGKKSRTDVVIAYIEGEADEKFVSELSQKIGKINTDALPLGHQSVTEALLRRGWYNPFPRVRMTERPDAASAHILEGGVALLCDTSPEAILLPTSIFDFLQETNDFYFPPLTGSYLRIMRTIIFASSIFISPVWYLAVMYQNVLPEWMRFLIPTSDAQLPLIAQLLVTELALDALKLASLTTPSTMSNSLSVIGGLLLGDFAVQAGWVIPEVVFYMAFASIANFTQSNYELGYTHKFFRIFILILTSIFGIYGFSAGVLIYMISLCSVRGVCGRSYLYPLIPWNGKALMRLFFRTKKE